MWHWLLINGIWVFIVSTLLLIVIYFIREWAQRRLKKVMPKERYERLQKTGRVSFWTVEGLALVIIVVALVAIVLSRQGAANMVTPETFKLTQIGFLIEIIKQYNKAIIFHIQKPKIHFLFSIYSAAFRNFLW